MKLMLASRFRSSGLLPGAFFAYVTVSLLIFTFLVPPFQKPDEQTHFQSVVSITDLDLICRRDSDGNYYYPLKRKYAELPELMHIWDVWDLSNESRTRFEVEWLRTDFSDPKYDETVRIYGSCNKPVIGNLANAHGPVLGYLPNAAGILLGKPFVSPLISFYLGRIVGALFFVLSVIISLRITPQRYRSAVYLYAAIPTVLHQVSAINYDAVQLSLFPLIFASLTNLVERNSPIPRTHLLAFMALILWLISARIISYFPFVLLFFALRPSNISTRFSRYAGVSVAFVVVATLLTVLYTFVYLPRVSYQVNVRFIQGEWVEEETGINVGQQVRLLVEQPTQFLAASYETVFARGDWLLRQGIATFGWGDTGLPQFFYYVIVFMAAFVFYRIMQGDVPRLGFIQIGAVLGTLLLVIVVLFLSLYLVASPVGSGVIDGLQGRYFIGLLPFAALGLSQLAVRIGKRVFAGMLMGGMVLVLLYNTYGTIYARFYEEPTRPADTAPAPAADSLPPLSISPPPSDARSATPAEPAPTGTPSPTHSGTPTPMTGIPTPPRTATPTPAIQTPTDGNGIVAPDSRLPSPVLPFAGSGGLRGK